MKYFLYFMLTVMFIILLSISIVNYRNIGFISRYQQIEHLKTVSMCIDFLGQPSYQYDHNDAYYGIMRLCPGKFSNLEDYFKDKKVYAWGYFAISTRFILVITNAKDEVVFITWHQA